MRILILFFLFLSLSLSTVYGQESIGFSDSENIEPLIEYRLPAWGYSNLFWDFSFRSNLEGVNRDDDSRKFNDISGILSPTYNRFYESEERVSTRFLTPSINYNRFNNPGFAENENLNRQFELGLRGALNDRFYLDQRDIFLIRSFQGNFRQLHSKEFRNSDIDGTTTDMSRLQRNFSTTIGGGVGIGRLRNINPMIRALRLNERLNSLGSEQEMTLNDLRNASEQFTKVNGYNQVYDRPDKYFWGDMDSEISPNLMALNPFDLFYLTDVSSESIGQRLEGWEVVAQLDLNHSVNYLKTNDNIPDTESSQLNRTTMLSPNVMGVWYRNLDLKNQVGLTAQISYNTDIASGSNFSYYTLQTRAEWLHTITDRFLAQPYISYIRFMNDIKNQNLSVGSSFNYYVENNLSIFTTIRYTYIKNEINNFSESRNRFQLNAGVRYYMRRGLF